jgi:uncharacterized membrane protein YphA (DoxX/SURF4 family)
MRLVAGITLMDRGVTRLWSDPPMLLTVLSALTIGAGLLLLVGLWTPIVGTLVAAIEVWKLFLHAGDPWVYILVGTLSAALAMLGPGAWSIDARLFGWKRIDLPPRKN